MDKLDKYAIVKFIKLVFKVKFASPITVNVPVVVFIKLLVISTETSIIWSTVPVNMFKDSPSGFTTANPKAWISPILIFNKFVVTKAMAFSSPVTDSWPNKTTSPTIVPQE